MLCNGTNLNDDYSTEVDHFLILSNLFAYFSGKGPKIFRCTKRGCREGRDGSYQSKLPLPDDDNWAKISKDAGKICPIF